MEEIDIHYKKILEDNIKLRRHLKMRKSTLIILVKLQCHRYSSFCRTEDEFAHYKKITEDIERLLEEEL